MGMAMLQAFKAWPAMFEDLEEIEQLLRWVVTRLNATSHIDIVFDCYKDSSLSAAGVLTMCCDLQLLAVQQSVQSHGARYYKLAATKQQLSHFMLTNGSRLTFPH